MVAYYLDASAAVKLYVLEAGSDWLHTLLFASGQSPMVLSSHLLRIEVWSAFARRLRERSITAAEHARANDWFVEHRHTLYRFAPVSELAIQQAGVLIEHHPLRAYDAMHLATALVANQELLANNLASLTFISADNHLLNAAAAEGLAVDNPNHHA
jgi:hypothetical protein